MDKIINKIKENYLALWIPVIFLFFYMLYTNQSVTLIADDFRYSLRSCFNFVLPQERITNFWQMIETAYYDYMNLCARYGTAVLIYFVLMFGTSLFKILNPIMIVSQVVLGAKIVTQDESSCRKKTAIIACVLVLLFSMISPAIMDEDVYWITGTITYSWPVTFILLHLNLYLFPEKKQTFWQIPLYFLLSVYLGSTSENISITTSVITLFICGYYTWVEKREHFWSKNKMISCGVLLMANVIQILSPGTRNRVSTFEEASLLDKIGTGTFSFAQYQFFLAHLVPALLIILILVLLKKQNKKLFALNTIYLLPLIALITIYSLPFVEWIYPYDWICRFIMPLDYYNWGGGMSSSLLIVLIYYFGVIGLLILDIFVLCWKKNFKLFVLFLYSACPLLALIPLGGAVTRVSYVAIFFMMLICSYLLSKSQFTKVAIIVLIIPSCYYYNMHLRYLRDNIQTAKQREAIYATMVDLEEDVIVLPKYRYSTHGNFVDETTWEHQIFKVYYDIEHKQIFFE